MLPSINVMGTPLEACSHAPLTGWFRDGCCNTDGRDHGSHTVCAQVTTPFLEYLKSRGNDLMTARPEYGFPGLKDGDLWCVCAASWRQAYKAGLACPVKLESTHARALDIVSLDELFEASIAKEV